jgi:hypothetical protein
MRTIIRAIVCCLLCASAFAQSPYRIGDARTIGRIDVSAQLPESIATNCVFWIKPTYNDGTNYYDLSRQPKNLTATNAATQPVWTDGVLTFDGSSDSLRGKDALHNPGRNPFSVVAVVMPAPVAEYSVICAEYGNPGANVWVFYTISNTTCRFLFRDGGNHPVTVDSLKGAFTTNTVSVLAAVRSSATVGQIWTNGVLSKAATNALVTDVNTAGSSPFSFGASYTVTDQPQLFFGGRIYMVAIFDRALLATEIQSLSSMLLTEFSQ